MAASSGEHSSRNGTRGGVKHHIPGPAGFKKRLGGIQNRCMVGSKCKYGHAFAVVEFGSNVEALSRSGGCIQAPVCPSAAMLKDDTNLLESVQTRCAIVP